MGSEKQIAADWLQEYRPADAAQVHTQFLREFERMNRKILVLDDDPTGVQTVHDVDVYTDWSRETMEQISASPSVMSFILTNSRSFSVEETTKAHREIAEHAAEASKKSGTAFLMISRGDSTLRGHYPLETQILRETLEHALGITFDGEVLCPYFKEGGRYTIEGVHYVKEGEWLIPASRTEFAKDKTFGYRHSNLAEYIEEKSNRRVNAAEVISIRLDELQTGSAAYIRKKLERPGFHYITVDGVTNTDIEIFCTALLQELKKGKNYIIRSAAAVPKMIGNNSDRPLLSREEIRGEECTGSMQSLPGGIVLVGSHVKKTTDQLNCLKETDTPAEFIEFHVGCFAEEGGLEQEAIRCTRRAEEVMAEGKTAVVYTSRNLLLPKDQNKEKALQISVNISNAVTSVISRLEKRPAFIIAKGGITSSDVGTKALCVKKALVLGQVKPGIPVWKTGPESKFPGMSYVIFPGNVGAVETLREIVELLV